MVISILEISKVVMQGLWYDYVKPKYGEKAALCHMDTKSLVVYKKAKDISLDIAKDVETRLDTSNYELERPLPKGKNKRILD